MLSLCDSAAPPSPCSSSKLLSDPSVVSLQVIKCRALVYLTVLVWTLMFYLSKSLPQCCSGLLSLSGTEGSSTHLERSVLGSCSVVCASPTLVKQQ